MIPIVFVLSLFLLPGAARAEEAPAKKIEPNPAPGEKLIQRFCIHCHSDAAVKRGNLKPWRELVEPLTQEEFHERVVEGVPPVMPGFPELAPLHTASMYAYLNQPAAQAEARSDTGATVEGADRPAGTAVEGAEAPPGGLEEQLSSELRCTCCGKPVASCSCGMVPRIRADISRLIGQGLEEGEIKTAMAKKYGQKILPIADMTETLPPEHFQKVADAYATAKLIPDTLEQVTCFCPCYKAGHANLLDCYKDKHAAGCKICLDEALVAGELSEEGKSDEEVVRTIHEQFRPRARPARRPPAPQAE
jgi:hypothetical protein